MKTSNSQKKLVRSRELSVAVVISQTRKIKVTNLSHILSLTLKSARLDCVPALQWGETGSHSIETIPPVFIFSWARDMCHSTSGSSYSPRGHTVTRIKGRHSTGLCTAKQVVR